MYFVYHGYVNSDNYDYSAGPIFKVVEFKTPEEVEEFKLEFEEEVNEDCIHVIFRVFEGTERVLVENEVVVNYKLVQSMYLDTIEED